MKEFCASAGNCLQTTMVNVKFSPNKALAKLRALPFQWQLQVLWAPLHDCRNRGRKREERIPWEEHKNWEDIPATAMRFDAEHFGFIPIRLTWLGMALGMISMCTFPEHPSPLPVPSTLTRCSPQPTPLLKKDTQRAPWSSRGRERTLINWL